MTIIESYEAILEFFEANHSFCFPDDIPKLLLLGDSKDEIEACVISALNVIEEEGYLKKYEKESGAGKNKIKKYIYCLFHPLDEKTYSVELSKQTCENIAKIVNSVLPMLDVDPEQKSNPRYIGEADIILLLQVVQAFAGRLEEIDKGNNKNTKFPTEDDGEE